MHRQALQHYEAAGELQRVHAEHERRAAERAHIMSAGCDPSARDAAAERRDMAADERDHRADLRDDLADRREHRLDEREQSQDDREGEQDERDRRYVETTAELVTPGQSRQLAAAKTVLRRIEAKLARDHAKLDREDDVAARDQAMIDRESADSARREPPPEPAPRTTR